MDNSAIPEIPSGHNFALPDLDFSMRKIELQRIKIGVTVPFAKEFLESGHWTVDSFLNSDLMADQVVAQFTAFLYGRPETKTATYSGGVEEIPVTWWQHLKLSLPSWVRKVFPVRTRRVTVSTYVTNTTNYICPHDPLFQEPKPHRNFVMYGFDLPPDWSRSV